MDLLKTRYPMTPNPLPEMEGSAKPGVHQTYSRSLLNSSNLKFVQRDSALGRTLWIVLLVAWEVASHIVPESAREGSPIVPSWEFVFTDSLKALSGNWTEPSRGWLSGYGNTLAAMV